MSAVPAVNRGLSPRVRGNRPVIRICAVVLGSIPACAGEPAAGQRSRQTGTVYPRVCGGTVMSPWGAVPPTGLSPRVRGNHLTAWPGNRMGGSIPACAGEPALVRLPGRRNAVYPRVCGGTPWTFDSDPCYHIRQGNNAAPPATFYQIARPPSRAGGRLFDDRIRIRIRACRRVGLFGC